jgi:hypothetical protein
LRKISLLFYIVFGILLSIITLPIHTPYTNYFFQVTPNLINIKLNFFTNKLILPRATFEIVILFLFSLLIPLYKNIIKIQIPQIFYLITALLSSIGIGITYDSITSYYQLLMGTLGIGYIYPFLKGKNIKILGNATFDKKILILFSLLTVLLTSYLGYVLYDHIVFNPDSAAELFTANTLAQGRLYAPAPVQIEPFFHYSIFVQNDRWISTFPLGHSLFLSLGALFKVPWIITPILAGFIIYLTWNIAFKCYNREVAWLSVILLFTSPFFILASSEYLNHITALFCFTLFLYGFVCWHEKPTFSNVLIMALGMGFCAITRPLTALGLHTPFIVYLIIKVNKRNLKYIVYLALVTIFILSLQGYFNYQTTGEWLTFGYEARFGNEHNPGFGISPTGRPHTITKGIGHAIEQIILLNRHLYCWPIPSLFFIFVLFTYKYYNWWDKLFVTAFIGLIVAYITYWYYENFFGPRFLLEATVILCILTARGVHSLKIPFLLVPIFGIYTLYSTIKGEIPQRLKLWQAPAKPIVEYFKHKDKLKNNEKSVWIVHGVTATTQAYIDPFLQQGPIFINTSPQSKQIIDSFKGKIYQLK